MLVLRNDVWIRQLALLLAACREVGHVDVELAATGAERIARGQVPADADGGGFTHPGHFEGRLGGACENQLADQPLGVDRR